MALKESGRYARGVYYSFVNYMLTILLGMATSILMARIFKAEIIGKLALISFLAAISIQLSNFGLGTGLVREISRYWDQKEKAFSLLVSVTLLTFLIRLAIIIPCVMLGRYLLQNVYDQPDLLGPFLVFFLFWITLDGLSIGINATYKAYQEMKFPALVTLFSKMTHLLLILSLSFLLGVSIITAAIISISVLVVTQILNIGYLKKVIIFQISPASFKWAFHRLRSIISFGLRFFIVPFNELIIEYTDTAMIGYFLTMGLLGCYSQTYRLFKLFFVIPVLVGGMLFPTLSRFYYQDDKKAILKYYAYSVRYTLLLIVPITVIIVVFSKEILLVFGREFQIASQALSILAIGLVFQTIGSLSGSVISSMNKPQYILLLTLLGAITNATLNLSLIPRLGIAGAAIASTTGYGVMALGAVYTMSRMTNWRDFMIYAHPLLAGSTMFLSMYLLGHLSHGYTGLMMQAVGGMISYLLTLVAVKALRSDDITRVRAILRGTNFDTIRFGSWLDKLEKPSVR